MPETEPWWHEAIRYAIADLEKALMVPLQDVVHKIRDASSTLRSALDPTVWAQGEIAPWNLDLITGTLIGFKMGEISLSGTNGAISRIISACRPKREITDEMIDRYCEHVYGDECRDGGPHVVGGRREHAREALEIAVLGKAGDWERMS